MILPLSWNTAPPEILQNILSNLDPHDLMTTERVSKHWQAVSLDEWARQMEYSVEEAATLAQRHPDAFSSPKHVWRVIEDARSAEKGNKSIEVIKKQLALLDAAPRKLNFDDLRSADMTLDEQADQTVLEWLDHKPNLLACIRWLPISASDCIPYILHLSLNYGRHEVAKAMLREPDLDLKIDENYSGKSVLYHVMINSPNHITSEARLELMQKLVNRGAVINACLDSHTGNTIWNVALEFPQNSNVEVVEGLLRMNASIHLSDRHGNTPLHLSFLIGKSYNTGARANVERIIAALRSAGAEINALNHAGKTPLDNAFSWRNIEFAKFLETQGARRSHS